jgi:RimJ/RimL family protein N-acetyltransferase
MFDEIRQNHFPAGLLPGLTVQAVDTATLDEVFTTIGDQIFSSYAALGNYEMPAERYSRADALRAIYQQTHAEWFVFYDDHRPVGWSYGMMINPSTFFMSSTGLLPQYRQRGIYTAFLRRLLPYLHQIGYERVTSNHMTNNRAVLIAKLKAGFFITGLTLDERYGAQVTLTYFFYEDRRQGFAKAYSLEPYPGTPNYFERFPPP